MDSSSRLNGEGGSLHPGQPEQRHAGGWDVFISHSGVQKGFAKGLYDMLPPSYNVFFDITRPSLPLAEPFPAHILRAAKTCRLALVVLSNDFLLSKWPMLELSAFIRAGVKVLPLFYELSPQDLKDEKNLGEWHTRWEEIACGDRRIQVSEWAQALQKLCSMNGLLFRKQDGELAYLREIVSEIFQMISPLFRSSDARVQGRDRLCKVLIDKFEELERRLQKPYEDLSRAYLLCMYGLPGSGKTTLCACLHDQLFPTFAGRALHLKLPTDPTPKQLLISAKKLFRLTNLGHHREKMMDEIEDLEQAVDILGASNLRSSRVFLVIDNISSQESIKLVEDILRVGVGAGSRVMLVARTGSIFFPLLKFFGNHRVYVDDKMRVPSLTETEAICVLMQHASGLGLASDCHEKRMEEYTSSVHQLSLAKIARMSAFSYEPDEGPLYLPLALKIIGSQLRSNGVELEKWNRRFNTSMMEGVKEDAVANIVEDSYQRLPEKLKYLFLDVACFMIPYSQLNHTDGLDVELLGFIHECTPETIKRKMMDLTRLCFLEMGSFIIHDLFLEFAKSIPESSSMYYCNKSNVEGLQVTAELSMMAVKAGLRAIILEVDEKCERFDFPQGLSTVKVVVVRECKSLEVLGLAGLKSLVCLEIRDCPRLKVVDLDPHHTYTLKHVRWPKCDACADVLDLQQHGSFQKILHQISQAGSGMPVKQVINKVWCSLFALGGWYHRPPSNGLLNLARQLKALKILRLEQTGITDLGDLSSCWPQLQVLEVLEGHLEVLELGNLPNLKQFFYGDRCRRDFLDHYFDGSRGRRVKPQMHRKPNLLAGCPELEDVRICEPSHEDGMGTLTLPPKLRQLFLKHIFQGEPELLELTSEDHSLEEVKVRDHQVLESVVFTHQFLTLVKLWLEFCPNLITITGMEWLPNLQRLRVADCSKLQSLENLQASRMLVSLQLINCPMLCGLRLINEHLDHVNVSGCPNVQVLASDLESLSALRSLFCNVLGNVFKLENLAKLRSLILEWKSEGQAANSLSLCCSGDAENCEQLNGDIAELQGMKYKPLLVLGEPATPLVSRLDIRGKQNLVSLDGVHYFRRLRLLRLSRLPKLKCLQGLESCTYLETLVLRHCPAVKELPSLCSLVNLINLVITHCKNLRLLKGNVQPLQQADFQRCENLEHLELKISGSLHFMGCKLASIRALMGWVIDEKVSEQWWFASLEALTWELTHNLLEKPRERMELAEQLVEILGVYLMKKLPAWYCINECFDFQWWVSDLKNAWRRSRKSFPRGVQELMEALGRVPLMDVLKQCHSDAHFRTSVANCLIEAHPQVLEYWIANLVDREIFHFLDIGINFQPSIRDY